MSVDCPHGSFGAAAGCPDCRMVRIEGLLERLAGDVALLVERSLARHDPDDPPLIDGCKIVHRGDGFDVCKIHLRHWKAGTQRCPGKDYHLPEMPR